MKPKTQSAVPESIEQVKLRRRIRIATYCGMCSDPDRWDDDQIALLDKLHDMAEQHGMKYMYRYTLGLFGKNRH